MELSREKINIAMARKQWNMAQLAKAYGVSRTRINSIMMQRRVTPACAGRMAKALGVDVTEILED